MATKTRIKPARVYWDACIFICWLNATHELIEKKCTEENVAGILEMLDRRANDQLIIVTSAITIAEVLEYGVPPENKVTLTDILWNSDTFEIVSASDSISKRAHDIRNHYYQRRFDRDGNIVPGSTRTPSNFDAVHLATALERECSVFYTYDGYKSGRGLIQLSGETDVVGDMPIIPPVPEPKPQEHELGGPLFNADASIQSSALPTERRPQP
jgi:predicted nucleic acid-binding protein